MSKLQGDESLQAMLPAVMEMVPAIQEIFAKKAESRPLTPEEYDQLKVFVDRVERRTIQIKEAAIRAEVEKTMAATHADIPAASFQVKLDTIGLKEHVFNILTEAGFETVGSLLAALKTEPDKVLGLAGIGPKAMQNIEETVAALTFPEAEKPAEVPAEAAVTAPAADVVEAAEAVAAPLDAKKPAKVKEEAEEVDETTKDGVSLEAMFSFKPETFTAATGEEEDPDKKKSKKKVKKKSVELTFDEGLGEVVGRKKHKRGDEGWTEE
jgi:N utilization substance protein A